MISSSVSVAPAGHAPVRHESKLRARAVELEGQFLAEMLRHAGYGSPGTTFSGGIGEEQFASFLCEAQAQAMARNGGIGLAEHFFTIMQGKHDAHD